jgi:hypothetical protein
VIGKEWSYHILVNLRVTNVQSSSVSNAKILRLKDLQFPDRGANGGPPDGVSVVLHKKDELLVQQNTIPDGETTSPL